MDSSSLPIHCFVSFSARYSLFCMLINCVLAFSSLLADKPYPFLYPAPPPPAINSMSRNLLIKCPANILICPLPSQQDGCSETTCLLLGAVEGLNLSTVLAGMLLHLSFSQTRTHRAGHILQKGPSQ